MCKTVGSQPAGLKYAHNVKKKVFRSQTFPTKKAVVSILLSISNPHTKKADSQLLSTFFFGTQRMFYHSPLSAHTPLIADTGQHPFSEVRTR